AGAQSIHAAKREGKNVVTKRQEQQSARDAHGNQAKQYLGKVAFIAKQNQQRPQQVKMLFDSQRPEMAWLAHRPRPERHADVLKVEQVPPAFLKAEFGIIAEPAGRNV